MENTKQPNHRLLVVASCLLACFVASQGVSIYLQLDSIQNLKQENAALNDTLTNAVSRLVVLEKRPINLPGSSQEKRNNMPQQPQVVYFEDFGAWQVGRRWGCTFEGASYKPYDLTRFGTITLISLEYCVCKSESGSVTIIRRRESSAPDLRPGAVGRPRPPQAGADEGGGFI